MEAYRHVELLSYLLDETAQKIERLKRAALAHCTPQTEQPIAAKPTEYYVLQAEREWLEKAHQGLSITRNAFEQISRAEDERSRFTRSTGS